MTATGALGTTLAIAPILPSSIDRPGFEALNQRTITPVDELETLTGFSTAATATAGASALSIDQTATFVFPANQYQGARFTVAGSDTIYRVTGYTPKPVTSTVAVTINIAPALDADIADNAALAGIDDDALILSTTDLALVETGDPVTVSAALGSLLAGATYYIVKREGGVSFAQSLLNALADTPTVIALATGDWTTQTLDVDLWKPCGELANVDEFGAAYEVVRANNLADGRTRKSKGSYDPGSVPYELIYDETDVGQVTLETAVPARRNYAVRIQPPVDALGRRNRSYYLLCLVMAARPRIGSVNDTLMVRGTLEINEDPVIVN